MLHINQRLTKPSGGILGNISSHYGVRCFTVESKGKNLQRNKVYQQLIVNKRPQSENVVKTSSMHACVTCAESMRGTESGQRHIWTNENWPNGLVQTELRHLHSCRSQWYCSRFQTTLDPFRRQQKRWNEVIHVVTPVRRKRDQRSRVINPLMINF